MKRKIIHSYCRKLFSVLTLTVSTLCAPVFFAQDLDFAPTADIFSGADFTSSAEENTETSAEMSTFDTYLNKSKVRAGSPIKLLVQFKLSPHNHIYWKNPGLVGMPFSITWKDLPKGITFGEWRWSSPMAHELSGLINYVYEDTAYIEIPVVVAKDVVPGKVKLTGHAEWLACSDGGCFPQDKQVEIEFEIVATEQVEAEVNQTIFTEAEKAFPLLDNTLVSQYSQENGVVSITVNRSLGQGCRFFQESSKFPSETVSVAPVLTENAMIFNLPLNDGEKIEEASDVVGVLVCEDGTSFEIRPTAAAGASAVVSNTTFIFDSGFWGLLLLAFAGGLILNLMPCVFPVLGLKIMHFVGKSGSDKKKIAQHGFVFGAGVVISFWILAGVLTILRNGGEQLGWGFQLQEPGFVYGMILLMLVFGLSMSGVFEFGVGATGVGGSLTEKSGYVGSFFSGVLAVIIATPCAAPFLAPALGSALTMPVIPSFALFTAIAVGLAMPYVVLSCAPSLLKFLPKPGAWMETFKQGMAFLLYAPALYFAWVLMGQVKDDFAQRDILISLAVIAMACWIYGRWCAIWCSRKSRIIGTLVSLFLFVGTIGYVMNLLYGKQHQEWVTWTPQVQAQALEEGKTILVDFTARWCATCQVNKRVYSDPELIKKLNDAGVILMRADWTNKDPIIATEIQKYGRAAVPVNVFLKKGHEPVILNELFSGPSSVTEGLEQISK